MGYTSAYCLRERPIKAVYCVHCVHLVCTLSEDLLPVAPRVYTFLTPKYRKYFTKLVKRATREWYISNIAIPYALFLSNMQLLRFSDD